MAPKGIRTTGEKEAKGDNIIADGRSMSGAHETRATKDCSSVCPVDRRSITGAIKSICKTGSGAFKDASSMGRRAQIYHRAKCRPQTAIINFFTSGGQENGNAELSPTPEDTLMCGKENSELKEELPQLSTVSLRDSLDSDMPQTREEKQLDKFRSSIERTGTATRATTNASMQPQN
ncbi:hypothetical protein NDU88_003035 [Pleurodeles waltl]|uniref:Uncharacterized protein n=1 Tax=Pleurodeles waltl TaxID=8319 RepID=A0AAV7KUI2_PLEWA|nr:hypothetical protein NDU88_003035 [Pleurodeles waltl]